MISFPPNADALDRSGREQDSRTGSIGRSCARLADATSLQVALAPLIVLPILGGLLLRTLRDPATHRIAEMSTAPV
ncbi:hypothetical protein AB0L57_03210 [Nocardia sp. NPDC052254]|uniref:hypothetical protein n=1 Tax=Nocardia sp. NPDC052254 TaxID=3155681 RepID=UPI00342B4A9E